MRLHRCPKVKFRVGNEHTPFLERSKGVLTGAASSGMLARVCIEDTFLAALPEMTTRGFELDGDRKLVGMSWSDNVFTFASTVEDACMMMDMWAFYLEHMCGLRLKATSHEVIASSCSLYAPSSFLRGGVVWKKLPSIISLGQCISCTGGQSEDRKRLKKAWEPLSGEIPKSSHVPKFLFKLVCVSGQVFLVE